MARRGFFDSRPFFPRPRRRKPGSIAFRRKPGWNGLVWGNRTREPGAARMAFNKLRWEWRYAFGPKRSHRRAFNGNLEKRKPRGGFLRFLGGGR